jgi:hypothetical protein
MKVEILQSRHKVVEVEVWEDQREKKANNVV